MSKLFNAAAVFRKKMLKYHQFLGCPMLPSSRNTVHWLFRGSPVEEVKTLEYRILAGGRVLEVNTNSGQFAGQFQCWTSASAKPVSVWVNVKKEGLLKII